MKPREDSADFSDLPGDARPPGREHALLRFDLPDLPDDTAGRELVLTFYQLACVTPGPEADDAATCLSVLVFGAIGEALDAPLRDPGALRDAAQKAMHGSPCAACGHHRIYARNHCRTCHRKLGGAGIPLGDDGRTAENAARSILATVRRLDALAVGSPAAWRTAQSVGYRLRDCEPRRMAVIFALVQPRTRAWLLDGAPANGCEDGEQ